MKEYKFPEITRLDQLNEDSFEYSYSDYMTWQFQERVEIIMGKIFPMSAPNTPHQSLAIDIAVDLKNYFKGKNCFVFIAKSSAANKKVFLRPQQHLQRP